MENIAKNHKHTHAKHPYCTFYPPVRKRTLKKISKKKTLTKARAERNSYIKLVNIKSEAAKKKTKKLNK